MNDDYYDLLIRIGKQIYDELDARSSPEWQTSPFSWLHGSLPSRTKGKFFEQLTSEFFAQQGFEVTKPCNSEADRLFDGIPVEIKGSTLWKSGCYKFQQLREQSYQICLCLGIAPHHAHCWAIPKRVLFSGRQLDGLEGQHAGKKGSDTKWLRVDAIRPPNWLQDYGGQLADGIESACSEISLLKTNS